MPETLQYGKPGPNNDKIGGIPVIHYFDFYSKGRGQVVRLLLIDAGIAFKDIRYTFEEYPKDIKHTLTVKGGKNPTGNIPIVELNGKILTQSYPIVRHWARVLDNVYDGDTEDERYQADRLTDIIQDWRTYFVNAILSDKPEENYANYCKDVRPGFLHGMEQHLVENELSQRGPFVIGKKFTYADMMIFQMLHDDGLSDNGIGKGDQSGLKDYPRLKELYNAVQSRPNIKAFLQSDQYRG